MRKPLTLVVPKRPRTTTYTKAKGVVRRTRKLVGHVVPPAIGRRGFYPGMKYPVRAIYRQRTVYTRPRGVTNKRRPVRMRARNIPTRRFYGRR